MKQIAFNYPKEMLIQGWYFKPVSNYISYFLKLTPTDNSNNIIVSIYELETPEVELKNNEEIHVTDFQIKEVIKINMWAKYYNVDFVNNKNQWYYHDNDKNNYINGQAEVMNYALDLGFKKGGVKIY